MYSLMIINGDLSGYIDDPTIEHAVFSNISWAEVLTLCRLAIAQGFHVLLWADGRIGGNGTNGEE